MKTDNVWYHEKSNTIAVSWNNDWTWFWFDDYPNFRTLSHECDPKDTAKNGWIYIGEL